MLRQNLQIIAVLAVVLAIILAGLIIGNSEVMSGGIGLMAGCILVIGYYAIRGRDSR